MDSPTTASARPDGAAWASADMLAISIRQLREWQTQASRHLVVMPKSDDECWEDTEIDVRRKVL